MAIPNQDRVTYEKPTSLPWRNTGNVCFLAPPGKCIERLTADHDRLFACLPSRPYKSDWVMASDANVGVFLISPDKFPLTVILKDIEGSGSQLDEPFTKPPPALVP